MSRALAWLGGRLGFPRRAFHLRAASPADADSFARLHAEGFHIAWDGAEFERLLADPLSRAWLVTAGPGGPAAGFVLFKGVRPETEILSVAVARARRREGIGRLLLERSFALLAAEGFRTVFLEVEDGNAAALRLYEHLGFREIARRRGYYRTASGASATAIVMRRDIA
ncbi:GNAT family N-acetyltransferase [Ancylobacter sp. G4_0304]|uniref:GNAT family N-acetyltransferase n=1 Tax=Ancylobacter sp. G4_0304 TaxID=3114289 RepID=UPI0039C7570F